MFNTTNGRSTAKLLTTFTVQYDINCRWW